MNARGATALALKLAAIVLVLKAAVMAAQILPMMLWASANGDDSSIPWRHGAFVLPFVLQVIIFFVLMRAADPIARRLVPGEEAEIALAVDAGTVQVVAFTILGAVLVATGFPWLVGSICLYLESRSRLVSTGDGLEYRRHLIGIVPHVIRIIVGLFLFLRADGLHSLWRKLRKADGVQES